MIDISGVGQDALLAAAIGGDETAFRTLIGPHQRAIHLHCYRMLGSYHDAEEATQDVMFRAWRSLGTFAGRAPLRHWLYRIATTTCLKAIARRGRLPATVADLAELEPYPDRLLDQLAPASDPAAEVDRRESVALAFIIALQLLPATQRAALILRDVLAFSAAEVADLLDISTPAVNSLLQRARTTVHDVDTRRPARPLDALERDLVARFVDAWRRSDIAALSRLLHQDVILRMPPEPVEFRGRVAVTDFFATVPAGGRLDRLPLRVTAANGHPALAAYQTAPGGQSMAYGLMVLTFTGGAVATITGFRDPILFAAFALPPAFRSS